MIHLTIQQLSSYVDGELAEASAGLARQHLASCEPCAAKLAQIEAQGEALASALASHPDDAFFERITRGIEEHIRSPRPKAPAPITVSAALEPVVTASPTTAVAASAMPRRSAHGRSTRGRSPGPGLWATAAAVAVPLALIAVSIGVMRTGVGRHVLRTAGPETLGADRAQARPTAAAPETAATETAAPKSAAAVTNTTVASPGGSLHAPIAKPGSSAAMEAPPVEEAVPVEEPSGGSDAVDETDFVPVPIRADDALAAAASGGSSPAVDPFAHLSASARDAVRTAQRQTDKAVNDLSPEGFEAAAADWQRALPLLGGDAYLAASLGLAEARFHAWQLAPTDERAARARASAGAYLELAPAGPDREKASGWLSRLAEAGFR